MILVTAVVKGSGGVSGVFQREYAQSKALFPWNSYAVLRQAENGRNNLLPETPSSRVLKRSFHTLPDSSGDRQGR